MMQDQEDASEGYYIDEDHVETMVAKGGLSVTGLKAGVNDHDGTLSIEFSHDGKQYSYNLYPESVYSNDATVHEGESLLETGPVRTYRLREDGKWAAVTMHDDGTVQGLVEDNGSVIEIQPMEDADPEIAAVLMETYSSEFPPHATRWVEPPALGASFIPKDASLADMQQSIFDDEA